VIFSHRPSLPYRYTNSSTLPLHKQLYPTATQTALPYPCTNSSTLPLHKQLYPTAPQTALPYRSTDSSTLPLHRQLYPTATQTALPYRYTNISTLPLHKQLFSPIRAIRTTYLTHRNNMWQYNSRSSSTRSFLQCPSGHAVQRPQDPRPVHPCMSASPPLYIPFLVK
jgi:hypothetical protein